MGAEEAGKQTNKLSFLYCIASDYIDPITEIQKLSGI